MAKRVLVEKRYAGGYMISELDETGRPVKFLDPAILPDRYDRIDLTHCLKNHTRLFGAILLEFYEEYPEVKGYKFDAKFMKKDIMNAGIVRVPVPALKVDETRDGYILMDFN